MSSQSPEGAERPGGEEVPAGFRSKEHFDIFKSEVDRVADLADFITPDGVALLEKGVAQGVLQGMVYQWNESNYPHEARCNLNPAPALRAHARGDMPIPVGHQTLYAAAGILSSNFPFLMATLETFDGVDKPKLADVVLATFEAYGEKEAGGTGAPYPFFANLRGLLPTAAERAHFVQECFDRTLGRYLDDPEVQPAWMPVLGVDVCVAVLERPNTFDDDLATSCVQEMLQCLEPGPLLNRVLDAAYHHRTSVWIELDADHQLTIARQQSSEAADSPHFD